MGVTSAFAHKERPPADDVCPICFSEFVLPCRADCGHWFCGSCILQVWSFSSAFQACKCPMCCSYIKSLKPEASVQLQSDEEARKVLKSVERYNRLFVGGAWGFFLKIYDVPIFLRRMFYEMTDPNQVERHVESWRLLAVESSIQNLKIFVLGTSYVISPFKFIPGDVNVMTFCNSAALVAVILVKVAGLFKRHRSAERVRRLAAAEPPTGEW